MPPLLSSVMKPQHITSHVSPRRRWLICTCFKGSVTDTQHYRRERRAVLPLGFQRHSSSYPFSFVVQRYFFGAATNKMDATLQVLACKASLCTTQQRPMTLFRYKVCKMMMDAQRLWHWHKRDGHSPVIMLLCCCWVCR